MIRRVLIAAFAAALLLPATAGAAVTRAIQSVSLPTRLYWSPNQLNAQQGDTIEWRMTEPGNANAATHDIWLIKPGADPSTAQQIGATYLNNGIAHALVDQVGTYTFYCSIHGGLAPGGMNGTVTVGTTDPGPPVDPGQPWNDDGGGGDYPGDAWPNPTTAPTVFETGDNTPPSLTLVSAGVHKRTVKLVVNTSEAGQLTWTLKRKKKVVSSKTVTSVAGTNPLKVKIPNTPGDYVIEVVATDGVELESDTLSVSVTATARAAKAGKASYTPAKRRR